MYSISLHGFNGQAQKLSEKTSPQSTHTYLQLFYMELPKTCIIKSNKRSNSSAFSYYLEVRRIQFERPHYYFFRIVSNFVDCENVYFAHLFILLTIICKSYNLQDK